MKGLVAFAFALRREDQEPNPCNVRIAEAVERIVASESEPVVVVAQWEPARKLRQDGCEPAHVVELRADGSYLDSQGVWDEAKRVFEAQGITEVIPVAQPFLQSHAIQQMIKADGYKVVKRPVGWIGFDDNPANTQPWTRSPWALLKYAVKVKLGGARGHNGRQDD